MTDEVQVKEDPAPELQVVPIEDLDKIEKLLDVAMNTINTPNLSAIKQACLDELAQINASMAEAQGAALETYNKEMAEWSAKRNEERMAKEKEQRAKDKKAAEERKAKEGEPQPDSWVPPRDSLAQPIDRRV